MIVKAKCYISWSELDNSNEEFFCSRFAISDQRHKVKIPVDVPIDPILVRIMYINIIMVVRTKSWAKTNFK